MDISLLSTLTKNSPPPGLILAQDVNDADRFKRAWLGGGKQNGSTSASASGSSWLRPVWTEGTTKRTKKDGDATKASSKATWLQPAFTHKTKPRETTTEEKNQEEVETIADGLACSDHMMPRRINGKQKRQGSQQKQQGGRHYWTCPFCQTTVNCISPGSLASSKRWHVESRHPNVKVELVQSRKIKKEEIIRPSKFLPKEERGWSCPIPSCDEGLPPLAHMDRKRAIKFHCIEKHPDETPTTLYYKSLKGRPNAGSSKAALGKAEAKRKDANKGHEKKVTVDPGNGLTADLVFLLSMVLRLGEFAKITSRC